MREYDEVAAVVWKFPIEQPDDLGRSYVEIPPRSQILSVGFQGDEMVLWVLLVADRISSIHDERRRLIVVNTGEKFDAPRYGHGKFIGTAVHANGMTWHVFDGDA